MSALGELAIKLGLDSVEFQQGLTKAEYKARQFSERTVKYLENIESAATNINHAAKWEFRFNNIDRVKTVASYLSQIAERYVELGNKIKLVTESEAQHARAMADVYEISLKTAQSSQATSSVYQTFAQNAKELGLAQSDVARLTETVSKSVAISGASSAAASNALVQFSQSLLMGKMKAQEFNSLMTQTPSVIQAIAKGLGITTAELKAMVDSGDLTSQKMIEGLRKSEKAVDLLHQKTVGTLSGAFQNLSTATEKWVGEIDNALGVSNAFVGVINGLANNFGNLLPVVISMGSAWAAIHLTERVKEIYQATIATREQTKASIIAAQAKLNQAQSELTFSRSVMQSLQTQLQLARTEQERVVIRQRMKAQSAEIIALVNAEAMATQNLANARKSANLLSGAMAALGGPIGIVTMGLSFGATMLWEWYQSAEQVKQKNLDFVQSLDALNSKMKEMTSLELKVATADTRASIDEQKKKVQELEQALKKLQEQANQKTEVRIDFVTGGVYEFKKSAEQSRIELENVDRKTWELKQATDDLTKSEASLAEQMNQLPVAELRDRFAELFPNVEKSQINVDGLNISIGNFTYAMPSAIKNADEFASSLDSITKLAILAAISVSKLNKVSSGLSAEAEKTISRNQKQLKLAQLEQQGNYAEAAKLKAEMQVDPEKFKGEDYDAVLKSYEEQHLFQYRIRKKGATKGTSKVKPKKAKISERQKQQKATTQHLDSWTSYFDEIKRANADPLQSIALNEQRSLTELQKHLKTGVVQQRDAEIARTEIATRYAKERAELARRYVEKDQLKFSLSESLKDLEELQKLGLIGDKEAQEAEIRLRFKYAQDVSQYSVSAKDQVNGIYDPNQADKNKQAEELARLQAFNEQRLFTEEEFQQRKQAIIDRYRNEKWQQEMNAYSQGLNDLGGSFDMLAGIVERSAGKQSSAYKAMFAISKGFAIAEASIKLSQAVMQAMADSSSVTPAQKFANMAAVAAAGANVISQISSVGFAKGGYTGDGGKYTPAGIVHKGEYVLTKEATHRLGLDYLNYLNYGKRGFANGGGIAVPRLPTPSHSIGAMGGETTNQVTITVNIEQGGEVSSVEQQAQQGKQLGQLIQAKVLEVLSQERRAGGLLTR